MNAMIRSHYGSPDVLEFATVDMPQPGPTEIRLAVHAASVNPADRYFLMGWPYMIRPVVGLRAPRSATFGTDVAGVVDAIGSDVTTFAAGDRVVGASDGGYAEFATVPVSDAAHVPDEVSLTDAAALPIAGCTALQGWRKGGLATGQHVLVNGGSGGVGHYAVQLAKAAGARVTAVCSARNADLVVGFGADRAIDYATTDYTQNPGQPYDIIFDTMGNHSVRANLEALTPSGTWVVVNGPMTNGWVGPIPYIARAFLGAAVSRRRVVQFTADEPAADLAELVDHVARGTVTPHVERTFSLPELPDAIRHLATNRTRGKLVIQVA